MSKKLVLVALACACALAACGGDDDEPSATTSGGGAAAAESASLKVMLDWVPSSQQAGIHWAEAEGLYEAANLDVKIQAPPDPTAPAKFVATNRVDVAVYYQPDLMLAKAEGLPLKAVGVIMPRPLASVAYQPGATQTTVEALNGQKVASFSLPMNKAMATTIFEQAGMTLDDVEWQELGFNASTALRSKRVAATIGGFWTSAPEVPGAKYVPVDELGVPTYDEMIIVANSERLASDADYASAVERFVGAVNEGTKASLADPDALYEIIKKKSKVTDILAEENALAVKAMEPPSGRSVGCFEPAEWDAFTEWLVQQEMLDEPIPSADVVTNEYSPGCAA